MVASWVIIGGCSPIAQISLWPNLYICTISEAGLAVEIWFSEFLCRGPFPVLIGPWLLHAEQIPIDLLASENCGILVPSDEK